MGPREDKWESTAAIAWGLVIREARRCRLSSGCPVRCVAVLVVHTVSHRTYRKKIAAGHTVFLLRAATRREAKFLPRFPSFHSQPVAEWSFMWTSCMSRTSFPPDFTFHFTLKKIICLRPANPRGFHFSLHSEKIICHRPATSPRISFFASR